MTGKKNQSIAALAYQQRRAKRDANQQQEDFFTPKEGKKMNTLIKILIAAVVVGLFATLCGGATIIAYRYGTSQNPPAPTSAVYNPGPAAPDPAPSDKCDTAWAAANFGGEASWWESTAEGRGCHLIEQHSRVYITVPSGFAMEAYYDTKPGRDPYQLVAQGYSRVWVQGGTVWPDSGINVWCAMLQQKYPGLAFNTVAGLIDAIGFEKPNSCK